MLYFMIHSFRRFKRAVNRNFVSEIKLMEMDILYYQQRAQQYREELELNRQKLANLAAEMMPYKC